MSDAIEAVLLPCPFCGGAAEWYDITEDDEVGNAGGSCITCTKCQACGPVQFGEKDTIVEQWNRRPAINAYEAAKGGGVGVPMEPNTMDATDASILASYERVLRLWAADETAPPVLRDELMRFVDKLPPASGEREDDLTTLMQKSIAAFAKLSPDEQDAHVKLQRESWVRGEMGIGSDKDEAEARAAYRAKASGGRDAPSGYVLVPVEPTEEDV